MTYTLPGIDLNTLTIQTFDDAKQGRKLEKIFSYSEGEITTRQTQGAGVFWCINPQDPQRERGVETTTAFTRIALDIDFGEDPGKDGSLSEEEIKVEKDKMRDKLQSMVLPPSGIIETRKGFAPYWVFDKPQPLIAIEDRHACNDGTYKRLITGLEAALGLGKTDRRDISGVIRLPGTNHLKDPNKPFLITVTGYGETVPYDEFITEYLAPAEPKKIKPVREVKLNSEDSVYSQPIMDMLTLISGHSMVRGEIFTFGRENSNRTRNIIVNGQPTGQFVDQVGNTIGSAKGEASVNIVDWIAWYGVLDQEQAREELDRLIGGSAKLVNKSKTKLEEEKVNQLKNLVGEGDAERKFSIESLGELLDRDIPEECWLIDKIVPVSGLSAIAGPSGVGKSFYSLSMAQSVATGKPWLGQWQVQKTTNVLILDKENSEIWRKKRAKHLGMNECRDSIFYSKYPELFSISESKGDYTKEAIDLAIWVQEKEIGLIIFDSFVDFVEGDENSGKETQAFFDKIRKLFPGISIVLIVHFNKTQAGGDNRPLIERMAGSRNIGAQMDGGIAVDGGREDGISTFQMIKTRNSMGSGIVHRVRMTISIDLETNDTIVTGLTYEGETEVEIQKQEDVEEVILTMCPPFIRMADDDSDNYVVDKKTIVDEVSDLKVSLGTINLAVSNLKGKGLITSRKLTKGHKLNPSGNSHRYFIPAPKQLAIPTFSYNND